MKIKLSWALFLLTAGSYVAYPVWRLPLPAPAQWGLLNLFALLAVYFLYSPLEEASLDPRLPELKKIWPAALLAALLCLPLWLTPIASAYDEQSHAGPAAWFLGRLVSAGGLNIKLLPLFTLPPALLLAWGAFRLFKRGKLPGRAKAAAGLLAAANLWFLADLFSGAAGAIGRFETVLRYPPLSKFLYLPAYALFGVHEAVPRAVQFLFIAVSAVYVLRFIRLMKIEAPPALTYLLVALFPTFFNLSLTAELEAGTVFFFIAAIYHFVKAVSGEDRGQFMKCAFWLAAGFFYKQLLLGLMVAMLPVLLLLMMVSPGRRKDWLYGLKALGLAAAAGLPFIMLSAAYGIRDAGLMLQNLADPGLMLLNIKNAWWTLGPLTSAAVLILSAAAVFSRRGTETLLLLYFTASYYVMISASIAVGYIRHTQPSYLAPVILTAAGAALLAKTKWKPYTYALLAGLFIYQSVLALDPYQRKTFHNFHKDSLPYPEAVALISPGQRIYAPMELEPSHFYLAKAGLAGRVEWDRSLPEEATAARMGQKVRAMNADLVILPYSPVYELLPDFRSLADAMIADGSFKRDRLLDYHGNKLIFLKPAF